MGWVNQTARSTIGGKWVMAITGVLLYGFLIAHLAGNILVFSGQDTFNAYAVGLRALPYGALWALRIGLAIAFILHIFFGIRLARISRQARPVPYVKKGYRAASFGSRTMIHTGILVLLFLIYHLAHFTWHLVSYPGDRFDALGRFDAYSMVIDSFRQPMIAISYILAMLVLGVHLSHGLSSMWQTFGLNSPKFNKFFRGFGPVMGWGLVIAFISIPVAIWFGLVGA